MCRGQGSREDEVEKDTERYFRAVDRATIAQFSKPPDLPLVLVAPPEHPPVFRRLIQNPAARGCRCRGEWSGSPIRQRDTRWCWAFQPERLVTQLKARHIEITPGACVIEANASNAHAILTPARDGALPLVLLFNRSRLIILPETVSKAAGLREALAVLRFSAHNAIAIGDAESDHFLASQVWKLDGQYRGGWALDVNDRLIEAIQERYERPDAPSPHQSPDT